jgi:hypothetical protein
LAHQNHIHLKVYPNVLAAILFAAVLLTGLPCFSQSLVFNETMPQFGSVILGQSGEAKTLSISNLTHAPVLIQTITATLDFAQSNNCQVWLAEGSGCLVFVTFAPQTAGPRVGKLTVVLAGISEQSIALNGVGLASDGAGEAAPPGTEPAIRTNNNEEKAQKSLNDKTYSFQDLLNKNPAAIASSKEIFALTSDTATKQRMASILLSIGVKDEVYFEYLTNEAKKALAHDHDMPWPRLYDKQKHAKALNPALNEWCKTHNVGFWDMNDVESYEIPIAWYYLAAAGDPRAYDLLTEGLHSQNLMIVANAAKGLAKIQDSRAIDELIAAGRQVPAEAGIAIVQSLMYFADPRAQVAAEELLPEKEKKMNTLELFRSDMKKNGMRALFEW